MVVPGVETIERKNKKSKQQDKRVLVQGLNLPTPSITISKAPEALPKPSVLHSGTSTLFQFHEPHSTVGMARLKKRPCKPSATASIVPILPRQLPCMNPAVSFQLVTDVGSSKTLFLPTSSVPYSTEHYRKCKQQLEEQGKQKRKYTRTAVAVKCSKCGEDRLPPVHQQYMGYRHCATKDSVPFFEWREKLKKDGVARKKKSLSTSQQ